MSYLQAAVTMPRHHSRQKVYRAQFCAQHWHDIQDFTPYDMWGHDAHTKTPCDVTGCEAVASWREILPTEIR